MASQSVDEYIVGFPSDVQAMLEEVRRIIRSAAPEATERISYGIPTFHQGVNLVHFAGYRKHIGFYPGADGIAAFREELRPFKSARGSVQFPLDEALPTDLIRRMVEFRVRAVGD